MEELAKIAIILVPQERVRLLDAIFHSLDKTDPKLRKTI